MLNIKNAFRLFSGRQDKKVKGPKKYFCPICESSVRKWRPGRDGRQKMFCPECSSKPRQRMVWLALQDPTLAPTWCRDSKLLHIAPEPCLMEQFERSQGENYFPGDLNADRPGVRHAFAVGDIPFPDSAFDVIICNHVLEHVDDDRRAMSEFARVLKMNGLALITVPIDRTLSSTYEDFTITSPEERTLHFGRHDHVRKFGIDVQQRLSTPELRLISLYPKDLAPRDATRFGLRSHERLLVGCKRPAVIPASA